MTVILVNSLIEFNLVTHPTLGSIPMEKATKNLSKVPNCKYWVLVDDKDMVFGGCGYIKSAEDMLKDTFEINAFHTDPCIRGNGYGKALFKYVLTEAYKDGYNTGLLVTHENMKIANILYEKFHFTSIPVNPEYKKEGMILRRNNFIRALVESDFKLSKPPPSSNVITCCIL